MTSPFRHQATEYTSAQVRSAWLLHGFTTLGIVAAMLALRDVLVDRPDYAIIWLLLTLLIDGVDGPIARALEVEKRVPGLDGFLLDLIIDYVTCVVVPACFMYEFQVVPQNNFGIAVLCVMVFTSAIWFARKDMMTEDNWFRGFPAAWNIVGPLLFLLEATDGHRRDHHARALGAVPEQHALPAHRPGQVHAALHDRRGDGVDRRHRRRHARPTRTTTSSCAVMLWVGSAYFILLAAIRWLHDRRMREHAALQKPDALGSDGEQASAAEHR